MDNANVEHARLQWDGQLELWTLQDEHGTLWVPMQSMLRQVSLVLASYGATVVMATPRQFLDATAACKNRVYWDYVQDPGVARFAPGEVPHGKSE